MHATRIESGICAHGCDRITTPWLADAEVDALCDGLVLNAARVKYLRAQGLLARTTPNGRPLVLCSNVEDALGALPGGKARRRAATERIPVQPNAAGLVLGFSRKR